MALPPCVTVWNEYHHEKIDPHVASLYPNGIHETIAQHLQSTGLTVRTATLDQPEVLQVIMNAVHWATPSGTRDIHFGERAIPTHE